MRVGVLLLILAMVLLATGVPQGLHAREHGVGSRQTGQTPRKQDPINSTDTCMICLQFQAPMMADAGHAWLIDTGEWVPFVSMLAVEQASPGFLGLLSCRGPPMAV